jgi:hypothetical protein
MRFLAQGGGVGTRTVGCRSDVGEDSIAGDALSDTNPCFVINVSFFVKSGKKEKELRRLSSYYEYA